MRQVVMVIAAIMLLSGCSPQTAKHDEATGKPQEKSGAEGEIMTGLEKINMKMWKYNTEEDVYWQTGISYCETPAAEEYETLGIFVPGKYLDASDNGDGTFSCKVNVSAEVGGYTAETAPVVLPVDTPGYSAMAAPTDYVSSAKTYTDAGFIYVRAGCRGREEGAPAGVTDLKAAIRYIRYNEGSVPGNMQRIFSFGMSGGGAQSALLGATGNSTLYTPYLDAVGAVQGVSDAVNGSMCWCPITNLDYADAAYEWNLGMTRSGLNQEMQQLSDDMAESFASYINAIGLKDSEGNMLSLEKSKKGIYQAGSYYDYIKAQIERSLNNFLKDTTFPYTSGGAGGFGRRPDGELPDKELQDGELPDGAIPDRGKEKRQMDGDNKRTDGYMDQNGDFQEDGINRRNHEEGQTESKTYNTAKDYIDSLNADGKWITYDAQKNTATVSSVAEFVKHCKVASKDVGAFDDLNRTQGENILFGFGDGSGAHFDAVMADILKDNEKYGDDYAADLKKSDALGISMKNRMNMYNPMYYLMDYYDGYKSADVAGHWRIRTGIEQGDTALCTEVNLALALTAYGADVDFETVWGAGHVEAERTGSADENFIAWVKDCVK